MNNVTTNTQLEQEKLDAAYAKQMTQFKVSTIMEMVSTYVAGLYHTGDVPARLECSYTIWLREHVRCHIEAIDWFEDGDVDSRATVYDPNTSRGWKDWVARGHVRDIMVSYYLDDEKCDELSHPGQVKREDTKAVEKWLCRHFLMAYKPVDHTSAAALLDAAMGLSLPPEEAYYTYLVDEDGNCKSYLHSKERCLNKLRENRRMVTLDKMDAAHANLMGLSAHFVGYRNLTNAVYEYISKFDILLLDKDNKAIEPVELIAMPLSHYSRYDLSRKLLIEGVYGYKLVDEFGNDWDFDLIETKSIIDHVVPLALSQLPATSHAREEWARLNTK